MKKTKTKQRKRLEATTGQAQLIIEIIENHGKAEGVTQKTGISYHLVSFWRTKGHVPLSRVGQLARALKEDMYAFNYEGVASLLGRAPTWEQVVKGCNLSANKTQLILSKPKPRTLREILV